MKLIKKLDGIVDVDYIVIKFGDYIIDVIYGDKFIKDFLFKVKIVFDEFVFKVIVYGFGFINGNVNVLVIFIVDIRNVFLKG